MTHKFFLWLNAEGGINGGVSMVPSDNCIEITPAEYEAYAAEPQKYKYENGRLVNIARRKEYKERKNAEIKRQRAQRYAMEVDNLTAEYYRKLATDTFDAGEAAALKTQINDLTCQIKTDLPYLPVKASKVPAA